MATIKGLPINTFRPQPGFKASQNENGGWEGVHVFKARREAIDNSAFRAHFTLGTPVTSLDPKVPAYFGFMTLKTCDVIFGDGDIVDIETKFAGAESPQYGGGDDGGLSGSAHPTYSLNCGLQDAPLDMHPKWEALDDEEKVALGFLLRGEAVMNLPGFEIGVIVGDDLQFAQLKDSDSEGMELTSDDGKEFGKLISAGRTTYLRPAISWTERAEGSEGLSNNQINKIGEVSVPRGSPPDGTGARDWMLTSASQEQTGKKYTTFLEWTLSEKGGWNELLYQD